VKTYTDAEIWDACVEVMKRDNAPLPLKSVADAVGIDEGDVAAALIRETGPRRRTVTFRFPPLPCAAITAIS
jgi:hypothetical protein